MTSAMVRLEKDPYIFANWRHVTSGSVFFPGCNFPAFFPKTCDKLVELLRDEAGIGTVYDCCGLVVEYAGLEDHACKNVADIQAKLYAAGVTEVICACANCYDFFSKHLDIPVIFVFEKLAQLGLGAVVDEPGVIHMSCPARRNPKLVEQVEHFAGNEIGWLNAGCCGLSLAGNPEARDRCTRHVLEMAHGEDASRVYSFCGSCASALARGQKRRKDIDRPLEIKHMLSPILGVEEAPALSTSVLNRAIRKFK